MFNRAKIYSFIATITFMAVVAVCCARKSTASTDNDGLNATVQINAIFNVSISPGSVSFGSADPGESTDIKDVAIEAVSNNNQRWSIQMNYESPLTAGTHTIPDDSFKWWADTDGSGQISSGTGYLSTVPFNFYTAGLSEYITTKPVRINLHFRVDVPPFQARGSYSTILIFTMYEG